MTCTTVICFTIWFIVPADAAKKRCHKNSQVATKMKKKTLKKNQILMI